jgi:hypothetical protein
MLKTFDAAVIPARRTSSCLLLGIEITFLRSRGRPPKEFRHRPEENIQFFFRDRSAPALSVAQWIG